MAQSELFGVDETLQLSQEELAECTLSYGRIITELRERYQSRPTHGGLSGSPEDAGQRIGDVITNVIHDTATRFLTKKARERGIDIQATAQAEGVEPSDVIQESDTYFELVHELSYGFLQGLSHVWPFPID